MCLTVIAVLLLRTMHRVRNRTRSITSTRIGCDGFRVLLILFNWLNNIEKQMMYLNIIESFSWVLVAKMTFGGQITMRRFNCEKSKSKWKEWCYSFFFFIIFFIFFGEFCFFLERTVGLGGAVGLSEWLMTGSAASPQLTLAVPAGERLFNQRWAPLAQPRLLRRFLDGNLLRMAHETR